MPLNDIVAEFDQCIKCGLCMATCPVCKEKLLEKYSPRGKIQLSRYYTKGELTPSDHTREIFAECLLCGACSATCPSGVDLSKVFTEMREEMAKTQGIHPKMKQVVEALLTSHNISDDDNEERGEWIELIKDPPADLYQKEKARVAYFVGCVASFFPMVQNIPKNVVQILERADVDFTILAGDEWCCGFPLIGAGAPDKMEALKAHNLEKMKALGVETVVFSCPSCYRTWNEYYDTDLELMHSTQFMEKMIADGDLPLKEMKATVTYHDPCDLGRNSGVFDAPRNILKAIPGLDFVELAENRAQSICCGGGGNLEMADPDLSGRVAQKKIHAIQETGADLVVTSCQQCIRTIRSRARRQKIDLDVLDITEVVLRAMSGA